MKKNTFNRLKSIQQSCSAFLKLLNVTLMNFSRLNTFNGKILLVILVMLFGFLQASLYAQAVSGAAVKANFGIDADVYANHEQFTIPAVNSSNVDDWFVNTSKWPGSGSGIIDVDLATHPIPIPGNSTPTMAEFITFMKSSAGKNFPFERRMSQPKGATVNNYLWLDGVYGRDGIATQGYVDATVFTKTTDKNGQNPTTWNLGVGGTPAKNDIVDVVAHLRGDVPRVPDSSDPRPFTTLWGYGGATTISADGNSHNDFEFFRTEVTFDGTKLLNTGPNEGHTAWVFDGTGKILTPGDILISVDFENGGTKPLGSVRVWMKKTDVNVATFNALSDRKFDITGVFDGTSGAVYGYAEIAKKGSYPVDPNAVNPDIFAVVNVAADTYGAPWGSLEGQNSKFFEDIKKLQFSEFGINLTAYGLDAKTEQSTACASLLGTLVVKTRSSSSFTAELKDFAGPYLFGNAVQPSVDFAVNREINCINTNATITASNVVPTPASVKFYGPASSANGGLGPEIPADDTEPPQDLNRLLTQGSTIPNTNGTYRYTVVVSAVGFLGCNATKYVDVVVNKVAPVAAFSVPAVCVGSASSFTNTSTGTNLSYSWNFGDGSPASTATSPTHTYANSGSYTVTLTVTSGSGGTGCTNSISHTAVVNSIPSAPSVTYNPPACDETMFSIRISSVTLGASYVVKDKNGNSISGISPASPHVATAQDVSDGILFSNIPAGSGYQVTVSLNSCVSEPEMCPKPAPLALTNKITEVAKPIKTQTSKADFQVFPVPFKDQLTVRYNFDYATDVKIEVFNVRGGLVLSKYDSKAYANKEVVLDLTSKSSQQQVYVVKLTTNKGSTNRTVMSSY